jgi:hypothetical protein
MDTPKVNALVVFFFHGVDGAATDFTALEAALASQLRARLPDELEALSVKFFSHKLDEYAGRKTYSGIENLGTVAADEMVEFLRLGVLPELGGVDDSEKGSKEDLKEKEPLRPVKLHFSFVGHSLGGLVARYAASLLLAGDEPMVNALLGPSTHISLSPLSFLTVSAPHLGARVPDGTSYASTAYGKVFRLVAKNLYRKSGSELLLEDEGQLIAKMAEPDTTFADALGQFKTRTLAGLVAGDIVPYPSSLVRPTNIYASSTALAELSATQGSYGFYILERSGFTEEADASLFSPETPGIGAWTLKNEPPEPIEPPPQSPNTTKSPTSLYSRHESTHSRNSSVESQKSLRNVFRPRTPPAPVDPITTNLVTDPDNQVSYDPLTLSRLSAVNFRRVSIHLALPLPFSLAVHAMVVGKAPFVPAAVSNVSKDSAGFLASIIVDDFARTLEA